MLRKGDEPIPGYRLEKFLGKGQYGVVWKASAPGRTWAALKFIDLGGAQGAKEWRGIQLLKEIRHPHLMPITAIWLLDEEGKPLHDSLLESYQPDASSATSSRETLVPEQLPDIRPSTMVVAMLLADKSLHDVVEEAKARGEQGIELGLLLKYMEEAAKAIDFLNSPQHDLGGGPISIQHCDIKPGNLLIVGDSVQLCDFGLARMLSDFQNAATATGMVGSPAYMAPECIARRPSGASDQYSLAVSYVELRTGELPFEQLSPDVVLRAHTEGKLMLDRLPLDEQSVIRRATATNPADRYKNSQAMVRALCDTTVTIVPEPSRRGIVLALGGLAAAIGVAGLGYVIVNRDGDDGNGGGNGGGGGNGNGVTPPVKETYWLTVEPAEALVTLDGVATERGGDGRFELKLGIEDRVAVAAEAGGDYRPQAMELTAASFADGVFAIRLLRSAAYFAREARGKLPVDLEAAVELYRQAVELDADTHARAPVPEHTLSSLTAPGVFVETTPDSRRLVAACDDGSVLAWELDRLADDRDGTELYRHELPVERLTVTDKWVTTADSDGDVVVCPVSGGPQQRLTGHLGLVKMAIDPANRWLVTGGDSGAVRRFDLAAPDINASAVELGSHAEAVECVAIMGARESAITGSLDDRVRVWDLSGRAAPRDIAIHPGDVVALAVFDSQQLVAFGGNGRIDGLNRVETCDIEGNGRRTLPAGHAERIETMAIDASGRWLATGGSDNQALAWDLGAGGSNPLALTHKSPVVSLRFCKYPGWLAIAGNYDKNVTLWHLEAPSRTPLVLQHTDRVMQVATTADGRWLISTAMDGNIRMWDLRQLVMIKRACDAAGKAILAPPSAV